MPRPYISVNEILMNRHAKGFDLPGGIEQALTLAVEDSKNAFDLVSNPNRLLQQAVHHAPDLLATLIVKYYADANFIALMRQNIHAPGLALLDSTLSALTRMKSQKQMVEDDWYDGRTKIMVQKNPKVFKAKDNALFFKTKKQKYKLVTRHTRDFTHMLVSAGAGNRENILLDVESDVLKKAFFDVNAQLDDHNTVEDTLIIIAHLSKRVFSSKNVKTLEKINVDVPLSEFITAAVGVCRHHSLFNAYIISRIINERPDLLHGEIIHHRQAFIRESKIIGAHTWNVFKTTDGRLFNMDSLWKNGVFRLHAELPETTDKFYNNTPGIGAEIFKRYGTINPIKTLTPDENKKALLLSLIELIQTQTLGDAPEIARLFTTIKIDDSGFSLMISEPIAEIYRCLMTLKKGEMSADDAYSYIVSYSIKDNFIHVGGTQLHLYLDDRMHEKGKHTEGTENEEKIKTLLLTLFNTIQHHQVYDDTRATRFFTPIQFDPNDSTSKTYVSEPIHYIYTLLISMQSGDLTPTKAYDKIVEHSKTDGFIMIDDKQLHQFLADTLLAQTTPSPTKISNSL